MKKLIQLCSLLSLIVAFSFVSANAQSEKTITADIPFDFNVGAKHYDAGQYKLKVADSKAIAVVYITDADGDILDSVHVLTSGEAVSGDSKLVFNNYESQRFLAQIKTADNSYKMIRSGVERHAASGRRPAAQKPEVVAIALRTEL